MSPIPKPPRAKSPIEKAIEQLMLEAAKPVAIIVPPPAAKPEGPLMKAYRESKQQMMNTPLTLGRPAPMRVQRGGILEGMTWEEQAGKTQLERDLEDSLWALTEVVAPATPEEVTSHLPHLAGSTTRMRRVMESHVLILCPCKTAMQFYRCKYVSYTDQAHCAEEVRVIEAGSSLCRAHRP